VPGSRSALVRRALLRSWPLLAPLLPNRHRPWKTSGGHVFLNVRESPMMFARALGLYEVAKADAMRALLRPGSCFVDVGANKGDIALLGASLVGDAGCVLAFEPEPDNLYWIRRSLALNRSRNVRVFSLALSDEDGEASLWLSRQSGAHTLLPGLPRRSEGERRVQVRTLDGLLVELGNPRLDVLKLDVEGAELRVLRGASRALRSNPELVLLLDLHPWLGVEVRAVADFLAAHGYRLCRMTPPWDRIVEPRPDLTEALARRGAA
jgi:FkbM family methyltransferase